jgi:hypothetical protein
MPIAIDAAIPGAGPSWESGRAMRSKAAAGNAAPGSKIVARQMMGHMDRPW